MLVFFIIIIIIIILISTVSVGFRIEDLVLSNIQQNKKESKVYFLIYIFGIKIFSIKIKLEDIKKIYDKQRTKVSRSKFLKNYKTIRKFLKTIEIKKILLNINLGTEDVIITTYLVVILSTILSIIWPFYIKEKIEESKYTINPLYQNKISYKIELDCIIAIKTVHIIHIIYLILKKRRDEKYVRTSNRKSYESSYE